MDAVPQDKIMCMGRFPRRIIACMHHCPLPERHCTLFWRFFQDRRIQPPAYYNADGIGEKVMRRIVYDCDRCGKRDVKPVYALEDLSDGQAGELLDDEGRRDAVKGRGFPSTTVTRGVWLMMGLLHEEKGWDHLCGTCFLRVCQGVASALGEKRPAKKRREQPEPQPQLVPATLADTRSDPPKRKGKARKPAAVAVN